MYSLLDQGVRKQLQKKTPIFVAVGICTWTTYLLLNVISVGKCIPLDIAWLNSISFCKGVIGDFTPPHFSVCA